MTMVKLNNRPVSRHYQGLFGNLFSDFEQTLNQLSGSVPAGFNPPTNVAETDDAFHMELSVPGRQKELFTIKVEENVLTIGYEKPEEKQENLKQVRREFNLQNFNRSFSLGDTIDADAIQAKYENGLLKVLLPKKAPVKPESKQINIL